MFVWSPRSTKSVRIACFDERRAAEYVIRSSGFSERRVTFCRLADWDWPSILPVELQLASSGLYSFATLEEGAFYLKNSVLVMLAVWNSVAYSLGASNSSR